MQDVTCDVCREHDGIHIRKSGVEDITLCGKSAGVTETDGPDVATCEKCKQQMEVTKGNQFVPAYAFPTRALVPPPDPSPCYWSTLDLCIPGPGVESRFFRTTSPDDSTTNVKIAGCVSTGSGNLIRTISISVDGIDEWPEELRSWWLSSNLEIMVAGKRVADMQVPFAGRSVKLLAPVEVSGGDTFEIVLRQPYFDPAIALEAGQVQRARTKITINAPEVVPPKSDAMSKLASQQAEIMGSPYGINLPGHVSCNANLAEQHKEIGRLKRALAQTQDSLDIADQVKADRLLEIKRLEDSADKQDAEIKRLKKDLEWETKSLKGALGAACNEYSELKLLKEENERLVVKDGMRQRELDRLRALEDSVAHENRPAWKFKAGDRIGPFAFDMEVEVRGVVRAGVIGLAGVLPQPTPYVAPQPIKFRRRGRERRPDSNA